VKLSSYSTPSPGITTFKPTLLAESTHSIQQTFTGCHHVLASGSNLLTVYPVTLTLPLWASVPPLKIWHRGSPGTKMDSEFPSGLGKLEFCDWLVISATGEPPPIISSTQNTVSGHSRFQLRNPYYVPGTVQVQRFH